MSIIKSLKSFAEKHPVLTLNILQIGRAFGRMISWIKEDDLEAQPEKKQVNDVAGNILADPAQQRTSPPLTGRVINTDSSIGTRAPVPTPTGPTIAELIRTQAFSTDPLGTRLYHSFAEEMGFDDPEAVRTATLNAERKLLSRIDTSMKNTSAYKRHDDLLALDEIIANDPNASDISTTKELRKPYVLFKAMTDAFEYEKRARLRFLRAHLNKLPENERSNSPLNAAIKDLMAERFELNKYLSETSQDFYKEKSGDLTALALTFNVTINVYEIGEKGPFITKTYGDGAKQVNLLKDGIHYLSCTPKPTDWFTYAKQHPLLSAITAGTAPFISRFVRWIESLFSDEVKKVNQTATAILQKPRDLKKAASLKARAALPPGVVEGPKVYKIPKDGNSLFHSIAFQLFSNHNYRGVRYEIVEAQKNLLSSLGLSPRKPGDRSAREIVETLKADATDGFKAGLKDAFILFDQMERRFEGQRTLKISRLVQDLVTCQNSIYAGFIDTPSGLATLNSIRNELQELNARQFDPFEYLEIMDQEGTPGSYPELLAFATGTPHDVKINVYTLEALGPVLRPGNVYGKGSKEINIIVDRNDNFMPFYPAQQLAPAEPVAPPPAPEPITPGPALVDVAPDATNLYHTVASLVKAGSFNEVRENAVAKIVDMLNSINNEPDDTGKAARQQEYDALITQYNKSSDTKAKHEILKKLAPYQLYNAMQEDFEKEKAGKLASLELKHEKLMEMFRKDPDQNTLSELFAVENEQKRVNAETFNPQTYVEAIVADQRSLKRVELLALSAAYNITFNIYQMGNNGPELVTENVIGKGANAVNLFLYEGEYSAYVPGNEVNIRPTVTKGVLIDVKGGGNCLFYSIANLLGQDESKHKIVRATVVNQQKVILRKNAPIEKQELEMAMLSAFEDERDSKLAELRSELATLEFKRNENAISAEDYEKERSALMDKVGKIQDEEFTLKAYLKRMAQDKTFANQAEIIAVASAYDATVNVWTKGKGNVPELNKNLSHPGGERVFNLYLEGSHYQPYVPDVDS